MRTDLLAGSSPAANYPATTTPAAGKNATAATPAASAPASTAVASATPAASASAVTATDTTAAPNDAQLKKSVDALNRYIQPQQGSIEFSVDETSGKTLVKVVDTETNEVLLQVPSKQALALSESLGKPTGNLISDSA